MSGSYRGDSWGQPEGTINEAATTIANTTGTTAPAGRWTGRTGITDHFGFVILFSLGRVQINTGWFRYRVTGLLHETEGVPMPGTLPAPIRCDRRSL